MASNITCLFKMLITWLKKQKCKSLICAVQFLPSHANVDLAMVQAVDKALHKCGPL